MKVIAVDVMGNDNGVQPVVEAALFFLDKNVDFKIILVGDRSEIIKYSKENERLEIIDIKGVVDANKGALAARNKKTSMNYAISLLKDQKADAILSTGSSAALLSNSILILKRIEKVSRPAFMSIIPHINRDKKFIFLDAGANLQVDANILHQWAKLASNFATNVLNYENPKVAIANVGTEEHKGLSFHYEAAQLLKSDNSIEYIGFVEPKEFLTSQADIILADGYAGNMILKSYEGAILAVFSTFKNFARSSIFLKSKALFAKSLLKKVANKLDYRKVGLAWVIGVNGIVAKAHGSSKKFEIIAALNQIKLALENDFLAKIKKVF